MTIRYNDLLRRQHLGCSNDYEMIDILHAIYILCKNFFETFFEKSFQPNYPIYAIFSLQQYTFDTAISNPSIESNRLGNYDSSKALISPGRQPATPII